MALSLGRTEPHKASGPLYSSPLGFGLCIYTVPLLEASMLQRIDAGEANTLGWRSREVCKAEKPEVLVGTPLG